MNFEQFFIPNHVVGSLPGQVVAVLAPHPDDEVFGCGGTLYNLSRRGAEVHVAIVSESAPHSGEDQRYAEIRREESIKAATLLGYPAPEFWDLPDGALLERDDLERRIGDWLEAKQPDLVIAPSTWEMHRDHRAVGVAALGSMVRLADHSHLAMYEVGVPLTPNRLVDITPQAEVKEAAMNCFRSQLAQQDFLDQIRGLNRFRSYSLNMKIRYAEAFFLLSHGEALLFAENHMPGQQTQVLREAEKKISTIEANLAAAQAAANVEQNRLQRALQALQESTELSQQQLELSRQQLTGVQEELEHALQHVDRLEKSVREIFASTSWRVTKPLRLVTRVVRGEQSLRSSLQWDLRAIWHKLPLPQRIKGFVRSLPARTRSYIFHFGDSKCNRAAARKLLDHRITLTSRPFTPQGEFEAAPLDISVLTYNSAELLENFVNSLVKQAYPVARINLVFVDNDSEDNTLVELNRLRALHQDKFASIQVLSRPNNGFGAGNNAGIGAGKASFVLVVNPDVEFEPGCLKDLVNSAMQDPASVACWEARQKPYEHPKLYDPVTLEVNWCSHACVLLRRSAMEQIGGYDERIFLYAEDVEVSYRLREAGFTLKYVPSAIVWHYTYESAGQVKPAQYVGSIIGNTFLRTRYGTLTDLLFVVPLLFSTFLRSPFTGSRKALFRGLISRYFRHFPQLLRERKNRGSCPFPFRLLDYEQVREGAFWEGKPLPTEDNSVLPLVSIITRTVAGRDQLLKQAGLTVFNQTYPNVEWVVVEDGGEGQRGVLEEFISDKGTPVRYESLPKIGRSGAGNRGMEIANGQWLMFLDDDDCLYADHVETLMLALLAEKSAVAAYSLAWEVESLVKDGGRSIIEAAYHQVPNLRQPYDYECLRQRNYIPIQAILFKAEFYRQRGGFDVSLDYLEDWHLWQRYAYQNKFIYVSKTTSMHRTPMDSEERARRQRSLDNAYLDVKERAAEAIKAIGSKQKNTG